MTCGQIATGGCDHPDLDHTGPCITHRGPISVNEWYTEMLVLLDRLERKEEKDMARIDSLIRQAEALQSLIQEELEHIALFGEDSQYEDEATICFTRNFGRSYGRKYTYAAVKCAANKWYITGMNSTAYTWDKLVDEHLSKALEETGEVWLAIKWVKLDEA